MIKTIISYNVNGIRSALSKGLVDWIKKSDNEIICIQETKASIEQVELAGIKKLGYEVLWFAAEKKAIVVLLFLLKKNRTIMN